MAYLTNREQGTAGGFSSPSVTLFCLDEVERRQEVLRSPLLLQTEQCGIGHAAGRLQIKGVHPFCFSPWLRSEVHKLTVQFIFSPGLTHTCWTTSSFCSVCKSHCKLEAFLSSFVSFLNTTSLFFSLSEVSQHFESTNYSCFSCKGLKMISVFILIVTHCALMSWQPACWLNKEQREREFWGKWCAHV